MADHPDSSVQTSANGDAPKRGVPDSPAPSSIERHQDGEGISRKDGRNRKNRNKDVPTHWPGYVEAVCAIVLVLITGAYTYYAGQQARAAVTASNAANMSAKTADATLQEIQRNEKSSGVQFAEQLRRLDASVKDAGKLAAATNALATQAQRSADYAKQSIDTAVDAERPWVGVSFYRADSFIEGKTAKITINYTNTGKRPATATITYGAAPLVKLPSFPDMIPKKAGSVAFMLPGASNSATFSYDIPAGAFSDWKSKHMSFYILAEIVYKDVGTSKAYITDFCAYHDPMNKDIPFPLCPQMNQAK